MSAPVEFSAVVSGLDVAAQQWASYADALSGVMAVENQVAASEGKVAAAIGQTGTAVQGAAEGLTQYGASLTQVSGASDAAANSMAKFGSVFAGAGTSAQGASSGVTEFSGALGNLSSELQTTNADIGEYNSLAGQVTQTNSQIASSAQGVAQSQQQMSAGFKESIVGLGLATSGIVHIVGQYTQLERSQLLVARSSLTLEKSQNTLVAMQMKYEAALAKGTLTSEQQALAQAKLAAQQDAVGLAQERLNINTARLAETQANFAANIIPAIIQAATGIIGAFESMSVAFKAAGTTGFFAAAGIRAAMIATGVGAVVAIGTIALQAWSSATDQAAESAAKLTPELEGIGESTNLASSDMATATQEMAGGMTTATQKMTTDIGKLSQVIPADLANIVTQSKAFKSQLLTSLTITPAEAAKTTVAIKEDPTLKAIMEGAEANKEGLTFGAGKGGGGGGAFGIPAEGGFLTKATGLAPIVKELDTSIFKMSDSLQIFLGMGPSIDKTFAGIAKGAAESGETVLTFDESIAAVSTTMPTLIASGKAMATQMFGIKDASDQLAISIVQSALRISDLASRGQVMEAFQEQANLSKLIANFQLFGANADQIIAKSTEMGAAGVSLAENIQGVADSYTRVNPLILNMVNAQVEEANITKASEASWSKYLQTIGVKVPQGLKLTSDQMLDLAVAQKTLGESAGVMAEIHAKAFSEIHKDYATLLDDVAEGGKKAKEAFKDIDWKFIPPGLKKEIQDMVKDDAALVKQTESLQQAMMLLDRQMDIGALSAKGRAQWAAELSRDLGKLASTAPQLKGAFDPIIEFLATDHSQAGLRKVVAFIETEFVPAMADGAIDANESVDLMTKAVDTFGELDPTIQVPSWDKLKKALDDTGKSGQVLVDMDIGKAVSKSITPLTNLQIGDTVSEQFAKIVGAGTETITPPTVEAPVVPAPVKAADFDTQIESIKKSIETITGTGTGATAPKPLVLPPPTTATFISGLLDADNAMLLYIQNLGVLATTPLTLPAPITEPFITGMGLAAISIDALNAAMGQMALIPLIIPAPNTDNFTTGMAAIFAQLVTIAEAFDLMANTPLVIPAPNVDAFTKTFELLILIPGAFVEAFNQAMGGGGGAGGKKKKKGGGGGGSGLVIPAPDTSGFIEGMGVAALSIDALAGAMAVMETVPMIIPAPNTDAFTAAFELLIQVPAAFIEAFNEAMGSGGGGGGKKKKKKGKGGGGTGLIIPAPDSTQFVQGMTDAAQVAVDFTSTFLEIMSVVVDGFAAGGQGAEEFASTFDSAMSDADSAASSAASSIEGSMSTIADSAASAQDAVEQLGSAIDGLPSSKNINIHVGISGPGVKYLAEGFHGIIDKPTLLIVGEAGPERVDVGQAGGKASGLFMDRNLNVNPIMSSSEKTGIMGPRQQEKDALVQILSRKKKMDRDDIKELVEAMIDRMRGRIDASKRGAAGDMSREIKKFIIPVTLNWGKDVVMREIREGFLQD
jgi:hypothetical protein